MSDVNSGAASAAPAEVPSPLAGLGIVAVVAVAIIGWAIIGERLFQETSLFGGFLMLWHYANVEQLDIKKLPQALAGAVMGIALSWQVVALTQALGPQGTVIGLLVIDELLGPSRGRRALGSAESRFCRFRAGECCGRIVLRGLCRKREVAGGTLCQASGGLAGFRPQ
ncbi:MAG: hypothetical protein EBT84_10105 [Sphingomonadaceae bacterium]|nr:hypothetical protein [Sphingomonadaceae bacterium]